MDRQTENRSDYTARRRSGKYANTDGRIIEGFLDYISGTPFAEMSITGLCKAAGVSRNTFYEHYHDLVSVADACVRKLMGMADLMPSQAGYPGWPGPVGEPLCLILRRDRRYASLVFDPDLSDRCSEAVVRYAASSSADTLKDSYTADKDRLRVVCSVSVEGCLRTVRKNLDKTDAEWAEIKESIDRFNRGGLRMSTF